MKAKTRPRVAEQPPAGLGYKCPWAAIPQTLSQAIAGDAALGKPSKVPPADWTPERRAEDPANWTPPANGSPEWLHRWSLDRRDILNDRLRPLDESVLRVIIGFRKRVKDSAWVAKGTIAKRLGISERSVQHSLRRLEERGFIARLQLRYGIDTTEHGRDKDDEDNRTGWRIKLLFVDAPASSTVPPATIDRRPPNERKLWYRVDSEEPAVSSPPIAVSSPPIAVPVSTPGSDLVSLEGRPLVSSNYAGARLPSDGTEQNGPPPSSSYGDETTTFLPLFQEAIENSGSYNPDHDPIAVAVLAVDYFETFENAFAAVEGMAARRWSDGSPAGLPRVARMLRWAEAKDAESWGYVEAIFKDWHKTGDKGEPKSKAPKAPCRTPEYHVANDEARAYWTAPRVETLPLPLQEVWTALGTIGTPKPIDVPSPAAVSTSAIAPPKPPIERPKFPKKSAQQQKAELAEWSAKQTQGAPPS